MSMYKELAEELSFGWNICDKFKGMHLDDIRRIQKSRHLPYAVCTLNVTGDLNIGTIMRTSVLMAAERFIIVGRRKYDRRSTVGAQNYIDVVRIDGMLDELRVDPDVVLSAISRWNYTSVFVEQGGVPVREFDFHSLPSKPCLVLGNEGMGIPEELLEHGHRVSIPQLGVMRSLNVSSAAAIVMDHCAHQLSS